MPPTDIVVATTLAALAGALGPLLIGRRSPPALAALGWSNALAAGVMLGAAYLVMTAGLGLAGPGATGGAILGIVFTWGAHVLYGIGGDVMQPAGEGDAGAKRAGDEPRGDRRHAGLVATAAVHSAPEGLAIGAAWALDAAFGLFVAVTLAAHNVSEGAVLGARLASNGTSRPRAALLAVAGNVTQPLVAVLTVLVVAAWPAMLPWTLGAAFGALVYLCLGELLPESYGAAGRTSIAVVVSVAAGVVALLGGRLG
ncbi:MAG TPA: ZIP family metal transporter [Gemmatimonadales bacterium]